ncbi:hypothetical protein FJTKL_05818 [Diaporthe vaccinii]|uniref:Uncharacterized protein n=1 Tax=Diaporthe vaccinii TaxID=105482 RepID=A0ABR4EYH1_9PEZI
MRGVRLAWSRNRSISGANKKKEKKSRMQLQCLPFCASPPSQGRRCHKVFSCHAQDKQGPHPNQSTY